MPRRSPDKHHEETSQDELWQQAWNAPEKINAAKKQAMLDNLYRRMDIVRRRRRQLFFIGISAAAAILVAVFFKIPGGGARMEAPQWQELASNDSLKKIMLEDGSVLWLSPHSVIRVHTDFTSQRQTELKEGTVFFSVAKDAQHPFSIAVNRQQVTVLGTAFSIHKLDSTDIQLTVKEGKVALDNTSGRSLLTAGQQVNTNRSETGTIQTINPSAADWWTQQQVRLHNISLEELLSRVATYYRVQPAHGNINRKMKITMTWDMSVTLEDNLAVLNALTGYNIH